MSDAPKYAPLSARHKRVFVAAGLLAALATIAIAFGRMRLIQWWLAQCLQQSERCDVAETLFTWWWLVLAAVLLAIAAVAHWLTRDRLRVLEGSQGG